jgi:serine/threonine protein kinase
MVKEEAPQTHRFCLPPGTVVEDWRLEGCHGHGAQGIVYRAFRVGQESAGPVAVKMSLYPWDPRFMREVALLSLVHHESVPGLCGHGFWRHPSGSFFPFIVMQWVEGTPLYEWAREHRPAQSQLIQVLAQLARALQATHEASAVHRDVKGENALVRSSDGRAMLTDFGSGNYQAAARQTWQPIPPGTPAYQSPESGLFQIRAVGSPGAHYIAKPADDVFALGVTAYRLVTGEYPSAAMPQMDEEGSWHLVEANLRSPSELNPQVDPQFSALILRMLSLDPGARGTAEELAKALEALVKPDSQEAAPRSPVSPRVPVRAVVAGSALMFAAVLLVLCVWQLVPVLLEGASPEEQAASGLPRPDAGPADLGDTAAAAPLASVHEPSKSKPEAIGQEPPPEPLAEQVRPDAKGRCPGHKQIPINGGCWVEYPAANAGECEQNGLVFFKSRCYGPSLKSRRKPPPTSDLPR